MPELIFSALFHRKFYKLSKKYPHLEAELKISLDSLLENVFAPELRTHKLHGELKEYWAFSCSRKNRDLRVIFRFDGGYIYLENIGTHDDVY